MVAYFEDGVLSFARDEKVDFPQTVFNRANMSSDEYSLTYDMTMLGGYDGVKVEYVSPNTNKKTYIRYRITEDGVVDQEAENPKKITLTGCRNEYQARDRALLEVNRLINTRIKMQCKVLADGEYTNVGMMIQVPDTYDSNQQAGYLVSRNGYLFETNESIKFEGEMYVVITDYIRSATQRYKAYRRDDTEFGFYAEIPVIQLNFWDGSDIQSPSRWIIATQTELDSTLWRVDEKKPNSDGTTSLTLSEYSDSIYEYTVN
ncbi:host specificity factor TipJ family phage tail protein [Brenneria populi subsp. brevivirga]|uniref:host specificity factor TipJ family phage tail protein n=1 Tax=Brenneria populi TaxID=1505588 RepID=UPI002E178B98|nr:host specificity factor TipJ family phage tail protein [Brenneria populi subsp. brevivirga]